MLNGSVIITASLPTENPTRFIETVEDAYFGEGYEMTHRVDEGARKVTFNVFESGVTELDLQLASQVFQWADGTVFESIPGISALSIDNAFDLFSRRSGEFTIHNGSLAR